MKAVSNILLKLNKPLKTEIELKGGIKLLLSENYRPEWNATSVGTVHSASDFCGIGVKNGDEVVFSYQVVSDRGFGSDEDNFFPYINEPYRKTFYNGKGGVLTMIAVQGIIDKQWVGTYVDEKGELQDGIQGSEREVERWFNSFKFGNVQTFCFQNLIKYGNEQVWKCEPFFIFAKLVKKKLVALGDYIICKPIKVDVSAEQLSSLGIVIPKSSIKATLSDRAEVVSGGKEMGIKEGDTVGFRGEFLQKYDIFGKEYYIIEKKWCHCLW